LSLAILIGLLPFGIWATMKIPIGSADVHDWLPQGSRERQKYQEFTRRFGSDQILLVSWEGATLRDPRLRQYTEAVERHPDFALYFSKLVSPHRIVETLKQPPGNLEEDASIARLHGILIGPDGTAALLLYVSEYGVAKQRQTIEFVREIADTTPSLGREPLRLVGTVYEAYAIDEAAESSLIRLVPPSTALGLLVCWFCFGNVRAVFAVMLLAGVGQLIAVALVYYTGSHFSAVLIVLPTLVFMLTLSGAVHLMNYFFEKRDLPSGQRGIHAFAKGWWPCLLASATTSLGMGSLLTSQLFPVREFGLFSAVGLGLSTVVLLLTFPALTAILFAFEGKTRRPVQAKHWYVRTCIQRYVQWQCKEASFLLLVSFLLLCATCIGLTWLRSSTKFCDMFPIRHRTHQDMLWFEQHVGPIASVEVLLSFDASNRRELLEQLRQVERVANHLADSRDVGGVLSASSLLPRVPDARGIRATTQRSVMRKRIEENLDRLESEGLLSTNGDEWTWRVMAKVSAVSERSYGEVTRSIQRRVENALVEQAISDSPKATIEVTGLSPVMHETQVALLTDLGMSFLSAFLLITPVMMLMVRSVLGGLLIMLPNVLPITVVFGCMGWVGWSLDIAGILTASIALGIAVDDTLHFVFWYSRERKQGRSPQESIERTLHGCCPAMVHTTVISCCAMLPFLFAEFLPTQQFAKLMIAMLLTALISDLVVMPAILLSSFGQRVFRPATLRAGGSQQPAIGCEVTG